MSEAELDYFIDVYHENAIEGTYLKGRKASRTKRDELLAEKEKQKEKRKEKNVKNK